MNPVTDNSPLTLMQKLFLGALLGMGSVLLYHYGVNYYVRQNAAALGRSPGIRTRKIG